MANATPNPAEPKRNLSLSEIENDILGFWRDQSIFDQTVAARHDAKPFVFYDGPPFSTGMPHYGHILQMAAKDAVLRYKTMQGYKVPRKIGWDTHGLPVEYELEKELGISGKKQIEDYGIEKFVEAARGIVLRYTSLWQETMERMGRWMDVSHPYATMDNDYIESVWWAFKTLYDKGLVYKDFRVSPYCPRCGTVLSNFEVNLGYQDNVADPSVYVAMPLLEAAGDLKQAELVIWTTTPWTLPSNAGVAVDPNATYAVVRKGERSFIIEQSLVEALFGATEIETVTTVKGQELVGLKYKPPFRLSDDAKAYRVVDGGNEVTTTEGTGLLHVAPAYGEFDSKLGKENSLPLLQNVHKDGTIIKGKDIPGEGLFVKEADTLIIDSLVEKGIILKATTTKHTYPFCWRCSSPLLYFPTDSWFVKVTDLKDDLVTENKEIKWLPEHLRDGRFGRWLEGARDWAISRERYWGAPLPVWECAECHTIEVFGSRDELLTRGEFDLGDLHRPYIDSVKPACQKCHQPMQRVPFVFDCWFESGSMPYAQFHAPFANKDQFNPEQKIGYPADFIAEALDQTRGWFYTLHVLGVALFGHRAYDSVIVSGLLLAPDGKKLSKSLRNYVDPAILFEQEGVDALRLFLFTSASWGEDYRFSDEAVRDVKRRWIVPLLNVLEYYKLSHKDRDSSIQKTPWHYLTLDNWMQERCNQAWLQIIDAMEGDDTHNPYDLVRACRTFGPLVEDLSTWYVRLSRGRKDPNFSAMLGGRLLEIASMYAPFMPFLSEHIYQEVHKIHRHDDAKSPMTEGVMRMSESLPSVHMTFIPRQKSDFYHDQEAETKASSLLATMEEIRTIVTLGRELRAKHSLPLKQPLARLEIITSHKDIELELALVAQELQVEAVKVVQAISDGFLTADAGALTVGIDPTITPELAQKGLANTIRRTIQDLRKQAGLQTTDKAVAVVQDVDKAVLTLIQDQLETTTVTDSAPSGSTLQSASVTHDNTVVKITLFQ